MFAKFLKNMDPKPPYKEDKGKRSIYTGFLAVFALPGFIIFILLNATTQYHPVNGICVCSASKTITSANAWLFNNTNSLYPEYHYYPYKISSVSSQFTPCGCKSRSIQPECNVRCDFLQKATQGVFDKPLTDIKLSRITISCQNVVPGDKCSDSCLQRSVFLNNGSRSSEFPSDSVNWRHSLSLLGEATCPQNDPDARFCAVEEPLELCIEPSIGGLLAIIGSAFGLTMGMFVNSPAGMRLIFRKIYAKDHSMEEDEDEEYIAIDNCDDGDIWDVLRGCFHFILGLGYFSWLWAEFSASRTTRKANYRRVIRLLFVFFIFMAGLFISVKIKALYFSLFITISVVALAVSSIPAKDLTLSMSVSTRNHTLSSLSLGALANVFGLMFALITQSSTSTSTSSHFVSTGFVNGAVFSTCSIIAIILWNVATVQVDSSSSSVAFAFLIIAFSLLTLVGSLYFSTSVIGIIRRTIEMEYSAGESVTLSTSRGKSKAKTVLITIGLLVIFVLLLSPYFYLAFSNFVVFRSMSDIDNLSLLKASNIAMLFVFYIVTVFDPILFIVVMTRLTFKSKRISIGNGLFIICLLCATMLIFVSSTTLSGFYVVWLSLLYVFVSVIFVLLEKRSFLKAGMIESLNGKLLSNDSLAASLVAECR